MCLGNMYVYSKAEANNYAYNYVYCVSTFWLSINFLLCYIVEVLHKVWIPGKTEVPKDKVFTIKEKSEVIITYFDEVQEQLEASACMDDLLSGINCAVK